MMDCAFSFHWQSVCVTAFALVVFTAMLWSFRPRRSVPLLPPGPTGYPVVGNLFHMPGLHTQNWLTFAKWGKIYGDLCSVTVLGQPIVIINSAKIAKDMLAGKSSIYSDRPRLVMAGELGGWNQAIGASPYNNRWRHMRRLFHAAIGTPTANQRFDSGKEFEARRLLRNILAKPDKLVEHLRLTAGATMLRDTYGYEVVDEEHDPIIAIANEALDQFSRTTSPPYYLVEYLPWLRYIPAWFPGASFRRYAKRMSKTIEDMAQLPYDYTKKQIANGTAPVSFVSSLLETNPEDEIIIKWSAKSLYSGASDTSVSAIYACFLAMILFPETARRAQAEIDAVVGSARLPTFADRQHLPYINALVKEVLRWNSVTPLGEIDQDSGDSLSQHDTDDAGGPHRSTEDDVHDGYFIPAGSMILTNIWKMSHDETIYADPMTFNPDRFLGPNPEPDPMDVVFGFGRRSCPGIYFADAAIYIGCAMCLAVFDVTKYVDPITGVPITPVYEPLPGTVSHPTPFKCTIKPRNQNAVSLIMQADWQVNSSNPAE